MMGSKYCWVKEANLCRHSQAIGHFLVGVFLNRQRGWRNPRNFCSTLCHNERGSEELGLAPKEGRLVAVEPDFREMVAEDKRIGFLGIGWRHSF